MVMQVWIGWCGLGLVMQARNGRLDDADKEWIEGVDRQARIVSAWMVSFWQRRSGAVAFGGRARFCW